MFRNVFYDTSKSEIHLWEEIGGSREYTNIPWVPYFFQRTDKVTDIKTLDGHYVKKQEFNSYKQCAAAQKEAINMYENNVIPSLQFLAERYHGIPDEDLPVPKLKVYSIDIEVLSEEGAGFPIPDLALAPITVINIREFGGESYSWGLHPYKGNAVVNYINCKNEPDLIKNFITWFHKHPPDIFTGWNICADSKENTFGGFDIPYIVNRCKRIFGDDTTLYNMLSPINKFRMWKSSTSGAVFFDIAGVTLIDYMSLYKWYTPKNQENFTLGHIAKDELGTTKIDYTDYGDLRGLYKNNWNMYVEYNMTDNDLVEQLENKLGYIKLAQSLSLLCKTPIKSYNASVQQIEGLLLTHYRRNKLCAPFFAGGHQEYFPAAYVKDPEIGLHNWVIDIDIASSYPTSIIIMNMSPETYIGRIMNLREEQIIECCKNKSFDIPFQLVKTDGISKMEGDKLKSFTQMFKKKLITIAPCGTVFNNTKKGVYASIEKHVFFKRKEIKGKMIQLKKDAIEFENTDPKKHKDMKDKAARYFSLQWALKIVLNQAFGVLAVPYCRYFNTNIAEAITSCSKHTIIEGQNIVNRLLNDTSSYKPFNSELNKLIESINNS